MSLRGGSEVAASRIRDENKLEVSVGVQDVVRAELRDLAEAKSARRRLQGGADCPPNSLSFECTCTESSAHG